MTENINVLASKLKGMKNPVRIGAQIGTVKSVKPLKIDIAGGEIVLQEELIKGVCNDLVEREYKALFDECAPVHKVELLDVLKKGDSVLCIPCEGEQSWFIVDKVVNI